MLSLSLFLASTVLRRAGLRPPAGFVFLADVDGALLTDADGAYLMEPV